MTHTYHLHAAERLKERCGLTITFEEYSLMVDAIQTRAPNVMRLSGNPEKKSEYWLVVFRGRPLRAVYRTDSKRIVTFKSALKTSRNWHTKKNLKISSQVGGDSREKKIRLSKKTKRRRRS